MQNAPPVMCEDEQDEQNAKRCCGHDEEVERDQFLWQRLWLRCVPRGPSVFDFSTLPASFLLSPRRALAETPDAACATKDQVQFIVFNTSGNGDPINANVPGTYDYAHSNERHASDLSPHTVWGVTTTVTWPWRQNQRRRSRVLPALQHS